MYAVSWLYLVFSVWVTVVRLCCSSNWAFCAFSRSCSCPFCSLLMVFASFSSCSEASCVSSLCLSCCCSSLSAAAWSVSCFSCAVLASRILIFSILSSSAGRSSSMYKHSLSNVSSKPLVMFSSGVPKSASLTSAWPVFVPRLASPSSSRRLMAFCVSCLSLVVHVLLPCCVLVSRCFSMPIVAVCFASANFLACVIASSGTPADSRV